MRQSGLLLDDNRDASEACVTRPLVEIDIDSHLILEKTTTTSDHAYQTPFMLCL